MEHSGYVREGLRNRITELEDKLKNCIDKSEIDKLIEEYEKYTRIEMADRATYAICDLIDDLKKLKGE